MKLICRLLILLLPFSAYAQSPWTQKEGQAYTQLSFTSIANYSSLFGDPEYNTEREISDNTVQFFGEYGLTDRVSLFIGVPLKLIETSRQVDNTVAPITDSGVERNFGNIDFGLKYNFSSQTWVLSGSLEVEANTSTFDSSTGIRTGYDAWTVTPMFLIGRGFGKTFIQGFMGANLRSNDYSSNFRLGGEVGRKVFNKIWLIGFLDISTSLKNGKVDLPPENTLTGLYVNDQEFGAFGLKVIGEFTDYSGLTLGFGGAFFGNNVAKKGALSIGFYQKF